MPCCLGKQDGTLEIFLQQRCIAVQHLNPNSSDSGIPLRLYSSERDPGFGVFAHQRRDGDGDTQIGYAP